jgi:two-component sensor histidine kinase
MLGDIVRDQLASFAGSITIEGPPILLKPSAAQSFALVVHELATNAAKHGALSRPGGRVSIRWDIQRNGAADALHFTWQERGGPPISRPARRGFGTVLLEHAIAGTDSAAVIDFASAGLSYKTTTPVGMLTPLESPL